MTHWDGQQVVRLHLACKAGHPTLDSLNIHNKLGIYGLVLKNLPSLQYVKFETSPLSDMPQLTYVVVDSSLMNREAPLDLEVASSVSVVHGTAGGHPV